MASRAGGLEIDEDIERERRHWLYERIVWSLMALVVVAEILGAFGGGVLSRATAGSPERGLAVEYSRVWRKNAPTDLRFRMPRAPADGGELTLWIARRYLDKLDVDEITPEPERVEVGADRLTYVFNAHEPGIPAEILFEIEPQTWGRLHAAAGLEGGAQVAFTQTIFP
ncbi:MAG TPA: hypothetical protein VFV10_01495 [Gammaproteobacteria bacterium]|nr:hypothetical protein [Gammaproteobacteria bacterium]